MTKDYTAWCVTSTPLSTSQSSWVGDKVENVRLALYADADFAGCPNTARSTTGVYFALMGPSPHCGLAAISKRQSCVSHSTPEAELVAADHALRACAIPALSLWSYILQNPVIHFYEDNQTAVRVIQADETNMRHLARTHRIC